MNAFKRPKIDSEDSRYILILHNNLKKVDGKNYLQIVGIDVQTLCVVGIVDENGKKIREGLHTYTEAIAAIKPETVIKAKFKNTETQSNINSIRIAGLVESSWQLSIKEFVNRLTRHIFDVNLAISQTGFRSLLDVVPGKMSAAWAYVHVAESEIRLYREENGKDHYQIKIAEKFININLSFMPHIKDEVGVIFTGFALILCNNLKTKPVFEAVTLLSVKKPLIKPHDREDFDEIIRDMGTEGMLEADPMKTEKEAWEEYEARLDAGDDMESFLWGSQHDEESEPEGNPDNFDKDFSILCGSLICQEIAAKDFSKEKFKKSMQENNFIGGIVFEPIELDELFDFNEAPDANGLKF